MPPKQALKQRRQEDGKRRLRNHQQPAVPSNIASKEHGIRGTWASVALISTAGEDSCSSLVAKAEVPISLPFVSMSSSLHEGTPRVANDP